MNVRLQIWIKVLEILKIYIFEKDEYENLYIKKYIGILYGLKVVCIVEIVIVKILFNGSNQAWRTFQSKMEKLSSIIFKIRIIVYGRGEK